MNKKLITFFILILISLLITVTVFATDINDLNNKKNEINNQIAQTNEELTTIQSEMTTTLTQIQQLNESISQYEKDLSELEGKLENLQNSIDENEEKLKASEEKYKTQKEGAEERLIAMYEAGDVQYLDVLLNSTSVIDFISNYYLVTELAKSDSEILEEIEREKNSIELAKKSLEDQKEQSKTIKNKKEQMWVALQNTKTIQNSYMNKLSTKEKEVQTKLDNMQSQVDQVEAEIRQILLSKLDSTYVGGVMAWPTPGYTRITSPYGMRTHPITGVYKLHTGVDLGAPLGSNFIAANDGVVVKAGYNSAYGNMVIIDHGGGVSTLYAHGSSIEVTLGQQVKRGDIILKVGSTGYSTRTTCPL